MAKIILKFGREKSVINHHPWLFSGAIEQIEGSPENGEIVEVFSAKKVFLGRGFFNHKTSIAIRFLTFNEEPIDRKFWQRRFKQALALRVKIIDQAATNAYRLIHGEGDYLPGLVVDKYAEYLCVQISTSGMDQQKELVVDVLKELFQPKGIYERSDLTSRKVEGLPLFTGALFGEVPDKIKIVEQGINFWVDLKKGQKTGFFLDQRENRQKIGNLAPGKKVLNCFAYTGGFSLYAAKNNALSTTSVELSAEALELAKENFTSNGVDLTQHEFLQQDVFDILRNFKKENKTYDLIILDPPAFTKNADSVMAAARGYKDINLQAFSIMAPNGILMTCSCSQHIEKDLFKKIVHDAAIDAKREVQVLEIRGQASDHPIAITHPEGEYLKCLICRVI